jgi:aminopeptidase N
MTRQDIDEVLAAAARHAADTGTATEVPVGVGDPYFPVDGAANYRVSHHRLRITFDPATGLLSGVADLSIDTAECAVIALDFGLPVERVTVDEVPVQFHAHSGKLVVRPPSGFGGGPRLLAVQYSGQPGDVEIRGERSWMTTPLGALVAREPHSSAFWYPTNDHPTRKATYDTTITVPSSYVAFAPGRLVAHEKTREWDCFRWVSEQPVASYLYSLLIDKARWELDTTSEGWQWAAAYGFGVLDSSPAARTSLETTLDVVRWMSEFAGPYPFDAVGGAVTRMAGPHALETQTHPLYGDQFFTSGPDPYVVAHEIGHQWFGNSVSVDSWRDVWISEGMATYVSWMWAEKNDAGTTDELFSAFLRARTGHDGFWQVPPADPGPARMLSTQVYERGAMAVHVLRRCAGDNAFFRGVRQWCDSRRHGTGSVDELVRTVTGVSPAEADPLIQAWLYDHSEPPPPDGLSTRPAADPPAFRFIRRTGNPGGAH